MNNLNSNGPSNSLIDVIKVLYDKIFEELHVSSLAFYSSTYQEYSSEKGYSIIRCKPLVYTDNEYEIYAYSFGENEYYVNQILPVVFTDLNFIKGLGSTEPIKIADSKKHQLKYAIVISAVGGGGSSEGAVRYDEAQILTNQQKQTARTNIGAGVEYTVGNGLSLNGTTFSVDFTVVQSLLTAGTNISIVNGVISNTYSYTLPIASQSTLGGIMVGNNLNIDTNGVLSAINTTYTNGTGLLLNSTTFSVDTSIIATRSWVNEQNYSVVSVSSSGTSTDEVEYITINNTEKKIKNTKVTFVDWS